MLKSRITVTIDEKLLKEVTELAKKEERSMSQQIVYFVKEGVNYHYPKGIVASREA